MRELLTWGSRFRFSEVSGGKIGEMPRIEIFSENKEEIPPLSRANLIYIDIWNDEDLAKSRLVISWVVSNSGVVVRLISRADNPRLKKQYQADPVIADRILAILALPKDRDKKHEQYRRIETDIVLPKEKIPEWLCPLVTQVETWKVFFEQPAMKRLRSYHLCSVSGEGYYKAFITDHDLRLGKAPLTDEEIMVALDEGYGYDPETRGFDFHPVTNPPTIAEECVYWELTEPKILVILPHESSSEQVAKYYGYSEIFQKYLTIEKESQDRFKLAHQANQKEDEEKVKQREVLARQALFSP